MYNFSDKVPNTLRTSIVELFDYLKMVNLYEERFLEIINKTIYIITNKTCIDVMYTYKGKEYPYKRDVPEAKCLYTNIIHHDKELKCHVKTSDIIFLLNDSSKDPTIVYHELLHLLTAQTTINKKLVIQKCGFAEIRMYLKYKIMIEDEGLTYINEAFTTVIAEEIAKFYGYVCNNYTMYNSYCYITKTVRLFNLKIFGEQCNEQIMRMYFKLEGMEYIKCLYESIGLNSKKISRFFILLANCTKNILCACREEKYQKIIDNKFIPIYKDLINDIPYVDELQEVLDPHLFYFLNE